MAPSVTWFKSDGFFPVGHLKERVYAVRPRTTEDPVARLQAAVTTVDANMLRRVRQNAARRAAVCLEMDGACCNCETPMVWSFDRVRRVSWKLTSQNTQNDGKLSPIKPADPFVFIISITTVSNLCLNSCMSVCTFPGHYVKFRDLSKAALCVVWLQAAAGDT